MYAPCGWLWTTDLGDIEVVEHRGELHLFHLTLPCHDVVAHAVSSDGLSWKPLPPAIHTGAPGEADSDMIWTMSVTARKGAFYMLYTAISQKESGKVQRTNLAVSKDLIRWTKHKANPVAEAEPRWYDTRTGGRHMVSWRDPKVFAEGGTYYAAVCARDKNGPFLRRGTVGLFTSKDMIHWKVERPLFAPRLYYDLECPQIFKIGRYYYIMASVMEDGAQRYWIAENLRGPYRAAGDNRLAPAGHYAGRVINWHSEDLYFCWHSFTLDGVPGEYENARTVVGTGTRVFPAPLRLIQKDDGRLELESFSGWSKYRAGKAKPLSLSGRKLLNGLAGAKTAARRQSLEAPAGFEILALDAHKDFALEGTLTLRAASGGVAFCLEEDSSGYFVWFYPEESRVEAVKWRETTREDGTKWFERQVLQSAHVDLSALKTGACVKVQFVGGEIEVSVNGRLALAAVSFTRAKGRLGLFANCGSVAMENAEVTAMRGPRL